MNFYHLDVLVITYIFVKNIVVLLCLKYVLLTEFLFAVSVNKTVFAIVIVNFIPLLWVKEVEVKKKKIKKKIGCLSASKSHNCLLMFTVFL